MALCGLVLGGSRPTSASRTDAVKKILAALVAGAVFVVLMVVFSQAAPAPAAAAPQTVDDCTVDSPVGRNARIVIQAARDAKVGQAGAEVGLAVILVESEGLNLASRAVPESLKYQNDGVAKGDHDSINLFQQRVSMGWFDTVEHGMDPTVAAASFFSALVKVKGWEGMSPGAAGQAVQRSAFPARYDEQRQAAQALYAKWGDPLACQGPGVVDTGEVAQSGSWANPLDPAAYRVGSPFGPRGNIGWGAGMHKGQDLMVDLGTPVRSICDGKVTKTGWDPWGGGWMVSLDCGSGVTVYLMHNTSFVGGPRAVKAGEVVAKSGSTGHSTGPHVHLQVMVGGAPINPVPFMRDRGVPL